MAATIHVGDALDVLRELPEASFDACLTDPPYGLEFMGQAWDRFNPNAPRTSSGRGDHMSDGEWRGTGYDGKSRPVSPARKHPKNERCLECGKWRVSSNRCQCADPRWEYRDRRGAPPQMLAFEAFNQAWLEEVFRVLKPGAFLLSFGGTRTYHRLACAIEDAGFEIRDSILAGAWVHAQGFPKSHDVSKAIDRAAGVGREVVGSMPDRWTGKGCAFNLSTDRPQAEVAVTGAPATPESARWSGYGTALKPAHEPVVVAMKPLDGTFAENALRHGVAGLNVDGGRLAAPGDKLGGGAEKVDRGKGGWDRPWRHDDAAQEAHAARVRANVEKAENQGRWPANLTLVHHPDCRRAGTRRVRSRSAATSGGDPEGKGIYGAGFPRGDGREVGYADADGTEEVVAWTCVEGCPVATLDRQAGDAGGGWRAGYESSGASVAVYGDFAARRTGPANTYGDDGPASRFYFNTGFEPGELDFGLRYCAKASTAERGGTRHPTIKPLELVSYLAKLLLPPERDGEPRRLLVPFSGAGSEMMGALRAGWEEVVGIEQGAEWVADAERRIREDAPLLNAVEVVKKVPRSLF